MLLRKWKQGLDASGVETSSWHLNNHKVNDFDVNVYREVAYEIITLLHSYGFNHPWSDNILDTSIVVAEGQISELNIALNRSLNQRIGHVRDQVLVDTNNSFFEPWMEDLITNRIRSDVLCDAMERLLILADAAIEINNGKMYFDM